MPGALRFLISVSVQAGTEYTEYRIFSSFLMSEEFSHQEIYKNICKRLHLLESLFYWFVSVLKF